MSIRTTVTLDDDVIERVREHSKSKGIPFRDALNDLLRLALATQQTNEKRPKFEIKPFHSGYYPGLPYDDIEALIEYAEGPWHK